jgi:hypothetical protein
MRTTLDIADDILMAAKEIAASRKMTAGQVLSELARKALEPVGSARVRNGVPVLPAIREHSVNGDGCRRPAEDVPKKRASRVLVRRRLAYR